MKEIPELTQEMLNKLFQANVEPSFRRHVNLSELNQFTQEEVLQINGVFEEKFSVLGVDIYQYSLFPPEKQVFVPFVFHRVYNYSVRLVKENFSFIFQKTDEKLFNDRFISTGDGGFLIMETPLHSIIFGLVLEIVFRMYNSYHYLPHLREKIGSVNLRYSITYDNVYRFHSNYFGSAIINNARLLYKDKLNRLLIEAPTYEWFMKTIAGVEYLQILHLKELMNIPDFSDYEESYFREQNALIPPEDVHNFSLKREGIKSVDIQKIGIIRAKATQLNVYNLSLLRNTA